jgi:bacteriocin biosynthesis cyclodehydratase domain-containing protein
MAESAVVKPPLLLVPFDPWAAAVAALMLRRARAATVELNGEPNELDRLLSGAATAPSLAVLIGSSSARGDARRALEDRYVAHLTIEPDERAVWVGPAVIPDRPGCDQCWQARRRQHAESLSAAFGDHTENPLPHANQIILAAKAGLAVARRVLRAQDDEAGVVRRFTTETAAPTAHRVRAVSGCTRCDRKPPRPPGWSLHPHSEPARQRSHYTNKPTAIKVERP